MAKMAIATSNTPQIRLHSGLTTHISIGFQFNLGWEHPSRHKIL